MKTLAASDRASLIRLASTLPKGSEERKTLLAKLQKDADDRWSAPHFAEAVAVLQPHIRGMLDYLNKNSSYTWKSYGEANVTASLAYGEGASARFSAEAPRNEGGGFYTFTVYVNTQKDEVGVDLTTPRWQAQGGRPIRQAWGLTTSDLGNNKKLFRHVPGSRGRRATGPSLRRILAEEGLTHPKVASSRKVDTVKMGQHRWDVYDDGRGNLVYILKKYVEVTYPWTNEVDERRSRERMFRIAPDSFDQDKWHLDYHDLMTWVSLDRQSFDSPETAARVFDRLDLNKKFQS